jgi:ABC-type branched-subunit amino acid transport system substrate-binding protein
MGSMSSSGPFSNLTTSKSTTLRAVVGLVAAGTLVLTACGGSTLAPQYVAQANASAAGGPVGGQSVGGTVQPGTAIGAPTTVTGPGTTTPVITTNTVGTPSNSTTNPGTTTPNSTGGSQGGSNSAPPTGRGIKAGSCAGFKNATGITNATISIGNVADVSGPVPGIFTSAQQAVKAYALYFNSNSNICGRKLSVDSFDSQTNTGGDAVATQKTCDQDFAAVGSMSAFDSGGTSNVKACGIPELHAIITNDVRATCNTCFGAEAPGGGYFARAVPDFFTKHDKVATQNAAMLYVNAAAAVAGALGQVRAETRAGWKFAYTSSFDIAEFNYGPYVEQLKSHGVKLVQLFGSSDMAVRMARAFQAANYKPDLYLMNATSYDRIFAGGGSAVEGAVLYIDFAPIEEMSSNPELALYNRWLQQVSPGSVPTYFGLYAWSAARLFAEQATILGGKLTRANFVNQLRTVHNWTANGLHAPQDVGGKIVTKCARFIQLHNGRWQPYGGSTYYCGARVSSS